MICANNACRLNNEHAAPNQPDGTYLCYDCRPAGSRMVTTPVGDDQLDATELREILGPDYIPGEPFTIRCLPPGAFMSVDRSQPWTPEDREQDVAEWRAEMELAMAKLRKQLDEYWFKT